MYAALALGIHSFTLLFPEVAMFLELKIVRVTIINLGKINEK